MVAKAKAAAKRTAASKKAPAKGKAAEKKAAGAGNGAKKEGGWFQKGKDGFEKKHQNDALGEMRKLRNVQRVFLKAGEEAVLVFVDDIGFFINEHNLQIDGRWGNHATCTKDFAPCVICDGGHRSTYTAYFTVIDTRSFEISKGPREGETVKNRKILYPAKGSAMKVIEDLKKRYGSLVGRAFRVKRMSGDDPNCGRDFELKGKVDLKKIKEAKNPTTPIEYKEVLKPLNDDELGAYGFGGSAVLGEGESVGGEVNLADLVE